MAIELAQNALVTEEEAKAYLQVDAGATTPSDDLLQIVINGLSTRIAKETGRTYVNDNADDNASKRTFVHAGEKRLPIDDCRSITVVEVSSDPNDDDSWDELVAADNEYVAEPFGAPVTTALRFKNPGDLPATGQGWSALGLVMRGNDPTRTQWPRETVGEAETRTWVRVMAKWGYGKDPTTVPANVKLACLLWIQNINKRDQAFFSDNLARVIVNMAMPPDVKAALEDEDGPSASVMAV